MIKKIIPVILSLCLVLSISVYAENAQQSDDTNAPAVSEQMPTDGARQGGGMGGMRPSGGNFGNGERPTPPGMGNNNEQGENQQPSGQNNSWQGGNQPSGQNNWPGNFSQNTATAEPMSLLGFVSEYQTPIISLVLLALAFVFVKFYKRKNY